MPKLITNQLGEYDYEEMVKTETSDNLKAPKTIIMNSKYLRDPWSEISLQRIVNQ